MGIRPKNSLCINTDRVYDWILGDSTGSTTLLASDLPIALPADATNVEVNCILTDVNGDAIPINSEIDIIEDTPRQQSQLEIDGELVTLERVTFRKTVYAVLEVRGVDPTTGGQFLITSDPIPFNFVETAFLCAPVGTSLVVRISSYTCSSVINRDAAGAIVSFNIDVSVCQSIQAVSPVTLELSADLCMPREKLVDQCVKPIIPPQCSTIFPGGNIDDCD